LPDPCGGDANVGEVDWIGAAREMHPSPIRPRKSTRIGPPAFCCSSLWFNVTKGP
jgi:hypothetical protein